jgi:hypothetical protein
MALTQEDIAPARFVKIGSLTVSVQAAIVAACGVAVGLLAAYYVNVFVGVLMMIPFFVNAYGINCTIVGHCTIWAWTLCIVYVLSTVLIFARKFALVRNPKRK